MRVDFVWRVISGLRDDRTRITAGSLIYNPAAVNLYSEPAGYFLTMSAYGDRVHGDERGTVDRNHNAFESPPLPVDESRMLAERTEMTGDPMVFEESHRRVIELAMAEVCGRRKWTLHACHCRTNHIHVVISANASTSKLLHDLKAIATRRLREAGLITQDQPVWTEHGSTRYLWKEPDLLAACDYVVNHQGSELPGSLIDGPWANDTRSEDPQ